MKQGLKQLLLMLQFFSRLPLPWQLTVTEEDFHQGILFLPLVGLLLGAVNALAYWLGAMLGGRELAALAAIVSNLWLTELSISMAWPIPVMASIPAANGNACWKS